jgi:hypothetical protein
MSWVQQRRIAARSPESFLPEAIDFVGPQLGPVEDGLKAAFSEVLAATPTAGSAYLARIYRGNASTQTVALCIRSAIGVDDKLEERLVVLFKERFRHDQQLDVLFLIEEDELRLREVCAPFYERRA